MGLSTGFVIKRARQKKGLTQEELADLLRVSKSTVQMRCFDEEKLFESQVMCGTGIYIDAFV